MALRVLDDRRRVVEAHRLVVEQRRVELRGMVELQIGAGIGEQGEAGRVAFGKTIQGEGRDRAHDLLGGGAGNSLARHPRPELRLHFTHACLAALEPERAPQLLRLRAGESCRDHRHAKQLFLKERHAERALQDRLQARMRIAHRLAAAPPTDVGMHHVTDDRSRSDDRHLHHEVIERLGVNAGERRHLRATLHLEHADRIGGLERLVDLPILGKLREVELAPALVHHRDRFLDHRHHAQAE